MAYAQWIEVKIVSENMTLQVKNATLQWGKFYEEGDKDKEISTDDINKITVDSGKSKSICSCGRSDASSGTQGSFELYNGDTKIGKFVWECPWGKKDNSFSWTQDASDKSYYSNREGGNKNSGAIGNVTISCIKL
ncbi:aegerolysin family protein [uncultured Chryseobacterium sp.]|uniref:aegerolysin family protein n=1 Tax=uncultured Chryseobacterium sp. TaxID=259322 RepID=UPI0025CFB6BA|nr:aegerolysin family protein [uncultured Chryseobacterium sp.]